MALQAILYLSLVQKISHFWRQGDVRGITHRQSSHHMQMSTKFKERESLLSYVWREFECRKQKLEIFLRMVLNNDQIDK